MVPNTMLEVPGHPGTRVRVFELGLACCAIEVREGRRLAQRQVGGQDAGGSPPGTGDARNSAEEVLNVLVVAGTVTEKSAERLRRAYLDMPRPCAVLAFGACADTGGPYWDSASVVAGAAEVVPVDAWVPGCPPRPEDLLAGLAAVLHAR